MDRTDGGCVGGAGHRAGGNRTKLHEGAFADGLGLAVLLADRCTPESEQNLLDLVAMGQVTLLDDSVRIGHGYGHTWLPRIMLSPSVVQVAGLGRRHEE